MERKDLPKRSVARHAIQHLLACGTASWSRGQSGTAFAACRDGSGPIELPLLCCCRRQSAGQIALFYNPRRTHAQRLGLSPGSQEGGSAMMVRTAFGIAALALPLLLSGCSLIPMKRHLPVPKTPDNVQASTPEQLVELVNRRWDDFKNLTATVEIKATLLKPKEGLATDYPKCRGF